ncbi:MAG: DUF11 domain-containing protein, partial [Pseudarcicella sp.]|nr:DUF11 domain-containing protein [Pseudarcicella sp.]
MKKLYSFRLSFCFTVFLIIYKSQFAFAEGTKTASANPAVITALGLLPDIGSGAYLNAPEDNRIYFNIKDHTVENLYFGFDWRNYSNTTNVNRLANMFYRIFDPAGNVITTARWDSTSAANGVINTYAAAVAGPKIAGSPAGGYNPLTFDPTVNGDYYISFFRSNDNGTTTSAGRGLSPLFDFTVASGTTPINGRIHSDKWGFVAVNPLESTPTLSKYAAYALSSAAPDVYAYTNERITVKIDFQAGFKPLAFNVAVNSYGVSSTGTIIQNRQSVNSTSAPSLANGYKLFLNPPDSTLYPKGTIPGNPKFLDPAMVGCGPYTLNYTLPEAGDVKIYFDLNGTPGYQAGTSDLVLEDFNRPAGVNTINWNGNDGLGSPVGDGINMLLTLSYLKGRFNLPLYDAELNVNGVNISIVDPVQILNSQIFWDDTQLTNIGTFCDATTAGGTNNTTGTGINNSIVGQTSPGHAWNGNGNPTSLIPAPAVSGNDADLLTCNDFGNSRTINTWGWGIAKAASPISFIKGCADLSIVKSVNNPSPNVGSNVTFTLIGTNAGPSSNELVFVKDSLPSGYEYVSHTAPAGTTYNPSTGIWTIGTLISGQNLNLTITARVKCGGDFNNQTKITGTHTEPTFTNNISNKTVIPVFVAPILSGSTLSNCPATFVNLNTITANNLALDWQLKWHSGTPATLGNAITDPTNITSSGTYYASFYSPESNCYSLTTPVNVTINPNPDTPILSVIEPNCITATGSITINSPVGAGFSYSIDGINFSSSNTFTGVATGNYTVTAKSGPGCIATSSTSISAQPATPLAPNSSASANVICEGDNSILSATCNIGTASWYSDAAMSVVLPSLTVNPTVTTNYYVRCETGICNGPQSVQTISVSPKPSAPSIVPLNATICLGSSATLVASGCVGTVTWSNSQTGASISVSPTNNASFSATCTNASTGCTSPISAVSQITVITPSTAPSTSISSPEICLGAPVNLSINSNNCSGTIEWYKDGNLTSFASGNNATDSPTANAVYTATCNSTIIASCVSPASLALNVVVHTPPNKPSASGTTSTLCSGGTAQLEADGCINSTKNWSNGLVGDIVTFTPTIGISTYTAYCVDITTGCEGQPSEPFTITVDQNPASAPTGTASVNPICNGGSAVLTAGSCTFGTPVWYEDAALTTILVSTTVAPSSTSTYYVVCQNNLCKSASNAVTLVVNPLPNTPIPSPTTITNACPVTTSNLNTLVNIPVGQAYEWHNANNNLPSTLVSDPTSVSTGTFYVFAKINSTGCESPMSAAVTAIQDICPIATNDIGTYTTNTPKTISVYQNDNTGDVIIPTSVNIIGATSGVLIVPGEGEWEVNASTGDITFKPEANYTGNPTPITYSIQDTEGNTVTATVTLTNSPVSPVADNDLSTGNTPGQNAIINILVGDSLNNKLQPTPAQVTVNLIAPLGGTVTGNVVSMPGEGTWTYNPTTGIITFDPIAGFTKDPTPITYTITEISTGLTSNIATVSAQYIERNPTADDEVSIGNTPGANAVIDIIAGDLLGDSTQTTLAQVTVNLIAPAGGTVSGNVVTVPGEGSWTYNPTTGIITFDPVA